ncbi:MAG TPA: cation-transporting P-type ATPase [Thermodesulfovibrionales bacterium]|nr:cation-transporting P-type ATPase [Thermodesulfovibrionales bacterium]
MSVVTSSTDKESGFWLKDIASLLEQLNSTSHGLGSSEATARLAQFGPNLLRPVRKRMLVLQFLAKFRNPLVLILMVASMVLALTGDVTSFFIFVIRTRKNPFRSRPNPWLTGCSLTVVAIAVVLPFTPFAAYLGFELLPPLFFIVLGGMVVLYLLSVEQVKQWVYRRHASQ